MNARAKSASPGLAATSAEQKFVHSGREWIVLQEFTNAGQAASASSARHPGSFENFTASNCAVGAVSGVGFLDVVQAARLAARIRQPIFAKGLSIRAVSAFSRR